MQSGGSSRIAASRSRAAAPYRRCRYSSPLPIPWRQYHSIVPLQQQSNEKRGACFPKKQDQRLNPPRDRRLGAHGTSA